MNNAAGTGRRLMLIYCVLVIGALALFKVVEAPFVHFGASGGASLLLGARALEGILAGVACGAALALLGYFLMGRTHWGRALNRVVRTLLGSLHPADALLLAILSAAGEELLFRGLLLPYMGIVGSTALFGLAHFVPRRSLWPWSVWAALVGFGLAFLANRTGGLLAPFLVHFIVNGASLLAITRERR